MNRSRAPSLAANAAARIVSTVAAALLTGLQFAVVVSLAEEPPMAIAGRQRAEEVVAPTSSVAAAGHAHASLGEKSVAR